MKAEIAKKKMMMSRKEKRGEKLRDLKEYFSPDERKISVKGRRQRRGEEINNKGINCGRE